jgi:hypothetical protein
MTFDFRQKLTVASTYSDELFATLLLQADPLAGRLSSAQRKQIISGASQCGVDIARSLRERFHSAPPSEIAGLLGLRMVAAETNVRLILSSYDPNAGAITVHRSLILKLKQFLTEEQLLPHFEPEELAIAHELFHYCERKDAGIFSRRFKVTLWRVGPMQNRSTVPAASEIAAASCVKALCRLCFNPILLEPVILRWAGAESVEAWFDRLEQAKQVVKDGYS